MDFGSGIETTAPFYFPVCSLTCSTVHDCKKKIRGSKHRSKVSNLCARYCEHTHPRAVFFARSLEAAS